MLRPFIPFLAIFASLIILLSYLNAADWNRFRGPNGSGIASDANPPLTWSDSENIHWKVELPGPGASSPVISGDWVFVTCFSGYGDDRWPSARIKDLKRHLVCVDKDSGKIAWQADVDAFLPEDSSEDRSLASHGYASNTPAVDDERVYAFFSKSGVRTYSHAGELLWKADVGRGTIQIWGSGPSPVLFRDLLIVNAGYESLSLRGLDKKTGEEHWKFESDKLQVAFATPVLAETEHGRAELIVAVPEEIWGFDPSTGVRKWWIRVPMPGHITPSPIFQNGVIYASGGRAGGATVALRPGGSGDATETHTIWTARRARTYVPTPIWHEGRLHWIGQYGIATCLRADNGDLVYKRRMEMTPSLLRRGAAFYGSPVVAGDRMYMSSRFEGTFVIALGDKFEVLAQNRFAKDESRCNSTPALDGDSIYLRTDRFLYRIAPPKE